VFHHLELRITIPEMAAASRSASLACFMWYLISSSVIPLHTYYEFLLVLETMFSKNGRK